MARDIFECEILDAPLSKDQIACLNHDTADAYSDGVLIWYPNTETVLIGIYRNGSLVGASKQYRGKQALHHHNVGVGQQFAMSTPLIMGEAARHVAAYCALIRFMAAQSKGQSTIMSYACLEMDASFAQLEVQRHPLPEVYYCFIDVDRFASKNLPRQVRHFKNKGGTVSVVHDGVSDELADAFRERLIDTYVRRKSEACVGTVEQERPYFSTLAHAFWTSQKDTVHFYAEIDGAIVGVQTFIKHPTHLELSEGGFSLGENHKAYEAIVDAVVSYARSEGIGRIGYGASWRSLTGSKLRFTTKCPDSPLFAIRLGKLAQGLNS